MKINFSIPDEELLTLVHKSKNEAHNELLLRVFNYGKITSSLVEPLFKNKYSDESDYFESLETCFRLSLYNFYPGIKSFKNYFINLMSIDYRRRLVESSKTIGEVKGMDEHVYNENSITYSEFIYDDSYIDPNEFTHRKYAQNLLRSAIDNRYKNPLERMVFYYRLEGCTLKEIQHFTKLGIKKIRKILEENKIEEIIEKSK